MSDITRTNPAYAWRARTRSIIGEPELTPIEVAERAGVDLADARRFWRALGFPPVPDDRPYFTTVDATALENVQRLIVDGRIDAGRGQQLTRAAGQAFARLAEAHVAATVDRLERAAPDGLAAPVLDDALWAEIDRIVESFEPFLSYFWRRHLLAAAWRHSTAAAASADSERPLVVGFADLVGFTATSEALDEAELATMVDRFEARVYEQVPERQGRVVKMIGDEVMFCADHVADAVEIALGLVEAHQQDPALPDIRVGLAMGPTLSWQGDLFGPTVNRASRVVNVARPATVLVAEELVTVVRALDRYVLRDLGAIRLRGLGKVRLSVVRRG